MIKHGVMACCVSTGAFVLPLPRTDEIYFSYKEKLLYYK